jgi:hypothetical protein
VGKFSEANLFGMTIRESANDGSDFTNPSADYRRLFLGEDGQLHVKDSAGTVTDIGSATTADHNHTAAGGDGGDLDAPVIDGYAIFNEEAAPSTPAAGTVAIYAKSDGRIYSKDDAGVESGPFDAAGAGGGPLLYQDDVALHASGDDFGDDTLAAWTLTGIGIPGDVTAVTTEPYDDTCLDVTFAALSDRMHIAIPAGDFICYLSTHGLTDDTSPAAARGNLIGLAFTDNSGTGTGISLFNDNRMYMWGLSSFAWASTGNQNWFEENTYPAAASNWPVVYRLGRVGTTLTGGVSANGGLTWRTATRTDSTTFTRINIIRMHNIGGANPKLRLGRFNIV